MIDRFRVRKEPFDRSMIRAEKIRMTEGRRPENSGGIGSGILKGSTCSAAPVLKDKSNCDGSEWECSTECMGRRQEPELSDLDRLRQKFCRLTVSPAGNTEGKGGSPSCAEYSYFW